MSLVDTLCNYAKTDAPILMEFLYRYDPQKSQVFAFYEGDEDSSFYSSIIKTILDKECELEEIVAGCKNNVLKLWREFDWETYNQNQIAFFVDKDLSCWLGEPTEYGKNVFVTDEYSVENYIVNAQAFKAWLLRFEGFARARKQECTFMLSEFERCLKAFKEKMKPVMAQAVVAKRHNCEVSLGDYKITCNSGVKFEMKGDNICFEIYFGDKNSKKWGLTEADREEIETQIYEFEKNESDYSVRGKWALAFMAELGEYMRKNVQVFAPSMKKCGTLSPTCAVPTAKCFTALAPHCVDTVPARLAHFLEKTYGHYLSEK